MTPEHLNLQAPVSQTRFAEVIGVTRQAVNAMCREGLLAPGATAGEWLIQYTARLREQAAGRLGDASGEGLDLVQERAQLARAQREAQEMRNAETRKELIRVADIGPAWAREITTLRDRLLNLAPRLAPVLAVETDLHACHAAIDREVRQAITDLTEGIENANEQATKGPTT